MFTSIALFNILVAPLNAFPWVLNGLLESWVSLKRVEKFLSLNEINLDDYYVKTISGWSTVIPESQRFIFPCYVSMRIEQLLLILIGANYICYFQKVKPQTSEI